MSAVKWVVGMAVVVLTASRIQAGDESYLVKVKGLDKEVEMQVMTAAEYKALDAAIKAEQKIFPQVVAQAGKEWRADEFNKKAPFLGSKLAPRAIMETKKFPSAEKASEALAKYEDMQAKKEERELNNKKKKAAKSKEQVKMEADIRAVADLVKRKLEEAVAKGGVVGEAKGGAALEAGGAKVNAAVDKDVK